MRICCDFDVLCYEVWLHSERSLFKPPNLFNFIFYELLQVYFTLVRYPFASYVIIFYIFKKITYLILC